MDVRRATIADAPELALLLEEFNGPSVTPEQTAARMSACEGVEMTFLAEMEGQVVGFACLRLVPYMSDDVPYAELTELFVREAYRRRGVARALVAAVRVTAHEQGSDELLVLTGFNNTEALALYQALGFRDYALVMRSRL
jgi:GNAT superfamily N-acetyltransferase